MKSCTPGREGRFCFHGVKVVLPGYKLKGLCHSRCHSKTVQGIAGIHTYRIRKLFPTEIRPKKFQKYFASDPKIRYNRCTENCNQMNPKNTEDAPLKKTEKESQRKFYYVSNRELMEKLKKSLKKQPPGRVAEEIRAGGRAYQTPLL